MSIVFVVLLSISSQAAFQDSDVATTDVSTSDAAIETAARDWLTLVDAGNWDGSFEAAGSSLAFEDWSDSRIGDRRALDSVQRRKVMKIEHVGSPEGDFYGIVFRSTFSVGGEMGELVVLKRNGSAWQVYACDFG